MAKTANSYVPDQGELSITITSADMTAIPTFVRAETIVLDRALKSFKQVTGKTRTIEEEYVTGDKAPILSAGSPRGMETWEIVLLDDYHSGATGELGLNLSSQPYLHAVRIFELFNNADRPISVLASTPDGGSTGDIQITLSSPIHIESISQPNTDADQTAANRITIRVTTPGHTKAAHA
jgi:hypothetical protein